MAEIYRKYLYSIHENSIFAKLGVDIPRGNL